MEAVFDFGFIEASAADTAEVSTSFTFGFSWSFYSETTYTQTIEFNLSAVPSGYEVAPCLIAYGSTMSIEYAIYENYWWGKYPVEHYEPDGSHITLDNHPESTAIAKVDTDSIAITYCVRKGPGYPLYYYRPNN